MRGTVAHNVKEVTGYCTEYLVKLLCKSALLINKVFKFIANCTLGTPKLRVLRSLHLQMLKAILPGPLTLVPAPPRSTFAHMVTVVGCNDAVNGVILTTFMDPVLRLLICLW